MTEIRPQSAITVASDGTRKMSLVLNAVYRNRQFHSVVQSLQVCRFGRSEPGGIGVVTSFRSVVPHARRPNRRRVIFLKIIFQNRLYAFAPSIMNLCIIYLYAHKGGRMARGVEQKYQIH